MQGFIGSAAIRLKEKERCLSGLTLNGFSQAFQLSADF